jgi:hypothetical protein
MNEDRLHPRTLVREHAARLLVRMGAWDQALYVGRTAPIDQDEHFPNVCIFTQNERTLTMNNQHEAKQELSLLVEVRMKRMANMAAPWSHIEGLPNLPAQTQDADGVLDSACLIIENIIMAEFSHTRLTLGGERFDFEQVNEINTDLTPSGEGAVPFILAQIEFKLVYNHCYPAKVPETCPLEYALGVMRHKDCGDTGEPVPVQTRTLQPALPAPPT